MSELQSSVDNATLINVFRMLTDRLDTLEDMIEKNHKEQLRHFYSNRVGACEGWIFDVHCPVVHLNGHERIDYKDETKNIKEYIGIVCIAIVNCNIYIPEGEENLPTDLIDKLNQARQNPRDYSIYRCKTDVERTTSIRFSFSSRDCLSAWSTSQMFIDMIQKNFKQANYEHIFKMVDDITVEFDTSNYS